MSKQRNFQDFFFEKKSQVPDVWRINSLPVKIQGNLGAGTGNEESRCIFACLTEHCFILNPEKSKFLARVAPCIAFTPENIVDMSLKIFPVFLFVYIQSKSTLSPHVQAKLLKPKKNYVS